MPKQPNSPDSRLDVQQWLRQHLIAHPGLWGFASLGLIMLMDMLVLATSKILEAEQRGVNLELWQPFVQESTGVFAVFVLVPLIVKILGPRLEALAIPKQLALHLMFTVVFSGLHIVLMTSMRVLIYPLLGEQYLIEPWGQMFLYEYRKFAWAYLLLVAAIYGWRMFHIRLQGEAKTVTIGETQQVQSDRLLVKMLGKEFLIAIDDIDWVEAAGNYTNLHVGDRVYAMRSTMTKTQALLPATLFFRIHRSSIVNLRCVDHITAQDSGDFLLALKTGQSLNFSRRYRDQFKAAMVGQDKVD